MPASNKVQPVENAETWAPKTEQRGSVTSPDLHIFSTNFATTDEGTTGEVKTPHSAGLVVPDHGFQVKTGAHGFQVMHCRLVCPYH